MKPTTNITKFSIECHKCRSLNRSSHVIFYIDWEEGHYLFTCMAPGCGETEAFDEFGDKIDLKEGQEVKDHGRDKAKKLPN